MRTPLADTSETNNTQLAENQQNLSKRYSPVFELPESTTDKLNLNNGFSSFCFQDQPTNKSTGDACLKTIQASVLKTQIKNEEKMTYPLISPNNSNTNKDL